MLQVGLRRLVRDRSEALRRREVCRRPNGDHDRRLLVRLEDIDAQRRLLAASEGMPHESPHSLAVELSVEQLAGRRLKPVEVKDEPARLGPTDLHRREVTVSRSDRPQRLRAYLFSVDLDAHNSSAAPPRLAKAQPNDPQPNTAAQRGFDARTSETRLGPALRNDPWNGRYC